MVLATVAVVDVLTASGCEDAARIFARRYPAPLGGAKVASIACLPEGMTFLEPNLHQHAEAYCLMKYVEVDASPGDPAAVEWIWNSRDGVTPFCIRSRRGREARHADFDLDAYRPDYVPSVGERIFVDVTPDRARERRRAFVARWWDEPSSHGSLRERYAPQGQEEVVELLAQHDLAEAGSPDLVEAPPLPDAPPRKAVGPHHHAAGPAARAWLSPGLPDRWQ